MRAVLKGALAATLLAGSTLAGTAPAQARDHTGVAIAAGIIGLGIGAAIASDHHDRYDDRYYSSYGYDSGPSYYSAAPAYYGSSYSYYQQPVYGGYGYDRGYHRHHRDWNDRRDYDRGHRDHDGWDRDGRDWDHDRR